MLPPIPAAFLSDLAAKQHMSASTQNQALAALTFLYDLALDRPFARLEVITAARHSRHAPVVLSEGEIRRLLDEPSDTPRLCALLMYGSSLRLLECLQLRVKDVDVERREIVVRHGKGGKDRRTPLATASKTFVELSYCRSEGIAVSDTGSPCMGQCLHAGRCSVGSRGSASPVRWHIRD